MNVHMGSIIKKYCRDNQIKNIDLAKLLGITPDAVYKLFNSPNFRTEALLKLSKALKFDFFRHYVVQLENNVYNESSKLLEENEVLKKENHKLELENEILKKVLNLTKSGN